jgi:hypothetical protein
MDFWTVCEILMEICLFHLFTSGNSSSWAIDSTDVLFPAAVCSAYALAFRMAFISFIVTAYMP